MRIRAYKRKDYQAIKELYLDFGWFDPETDSKYRLYAKSARDKESILVAENSGKILGTVSLIEDGRIAWLFRLVGKTVGIRGELIKRAEEILFKRGYKEIHIFVLNKDRKRQKEYLNQKFVLGRIYKWAWKKI